MKARLGAKQLVELASLAAFTRSLPAWTSKDVTKVKYSSRRRLKLDTPYVVRFSLTLEIDDGGAQHIR